MADPMDIETWGTPLHRTTRTMLMGQRYLPMSKRKRANLMFNRQKARTRFAILAARSKPSQAVVRYGGWANPQSAEIKSKDVSGNQSVHTTSATGVLLNGIARGDDVNERVGRSIVMNGLHIKIHGFATATTGVAQIHRILVVMDRQANATAPNLVDILEGTPNILAPLNRNNRLRFNVLADFNVVVGADGEPNCHYYRSLYLNNVRGKLELFNGGDQGSIADIMTNSIYIFALGSASSVETGGEYYFSSRFFFKDK